MNFLLAVVLIVALGKILSELFERIGLVSMLGEFSTGLILGTTFLNLVEVSQVREFAVMGVILLLFLAGYEETNTGFLVRERKRLSFIALTGLLITLGAMFLFSRYFLELGTVRSIVFAFAFSLTDVAVGAKALLSTGKADTETGKSLLGLAVIDTIVGIILLAVSVTMISATSFVAIEKTVGGIPLFFGLVFLMGRYLPKLIDLSEKLEAEETQFSLALLSVFLLAFIAEELKLASVLGAYFAGIILQRSDELESHHFSDTMKSMAYGFFVPIFFGWMGLQANLRLLPTYLKPALMIAAVALGVKFISITAVSYFNGSGLKESSIYGFGLIPKGADNIVVLAIGHSLGVLTGQTYDMLLVSVALVMLVSILVSSVSLKKMLR